MTTANQIIAQALGLIGIRSSTDPINGPDAAIALERLNTLLDAWRADSFYAYATQTITGTLPANTQTLTIGPVGADLVLDPRPIRIERGSKFTTGGIDYSIIPVTQAEYEDIGLKAVSSIGPGVLFYDPAVPEATISFFPRASAAVTLSLVCLLQVSEFADLTTDYDLAPGYRRALVYSLAEECAPDFEREAPPSVLRTASAARRLVRKTNLRVPQLTVARTVTSHEAFLMGL